MNRFFSLLFSLVSNTMVYSRNEIKIDSLVIEFNPQNETYKNPIIHQEPLINSIIMELDNKELQDKPDIKSPDYLNYGLKLTPNLKPRKLSSTL